MQPAPSRQLLATLKTTSSQTAKATAAMIKALADVDAQKAWADTAYPSLFAYCRGELNWSEAVIKKRITAARATRRFPQLLDELESGALHLSAVSLLQTVLTNDNVTALILRARGASKREVERLVVEVAPKPTVPTRIMRLPQATLGHQSELRMRPTAPSTSPARRERAPRTRPRRAAVQPLSPTEHKLTVTIDDETRGLLEEVTALASHRQTAKRSVRALLREALTLLRRDLRRRHRAHVKRPKQTNAAHDAAKPQACDAEARSPGTLAGARSRHVPAKVVRKVFERDGERCTYRDPQTSQRCVATQRLQLDHIHPFALGGEHSASNLRVLCQYHNNQRIPPRYRHRTRIHSRRPVHDPRLGQKESAPGDSEASDSQNGFEASSGHGLSERLRCAV